MPNTIITHDAGSPRDELSPFWNPIAPLTYIGWGKSTQLGYGLGLTMGAKVAHPDKLCVNFWGDAAIGMTGMDFETCVRAKIPILSILSNNFAMATEDDDMVLSRQKYGSTDISGNYADFAKAMGGYGERVTDPDQILHALVRGIRMTQEGTPVLLEFITAREKTFSRVSAASPVSIEGTVQKGPFIVGSTVLINRLDSRGRSTPSTLLAEIEDSIGSFSFETTERGPVQIVATGYYFSELTGQISDGQLTLRALYEVSDDSRQVAHVNILTHLINDRVLELISDGQPSLDEAIAQAEDELIAALSDALAIPNLNEFSALSLYDSAASQNNTLGNAYLLALSTGFYKYAKTKAQEFGTATDAELTLVLNRVSDDLAGRRSSSAGPVHRRIRYCNSEPEPRDDRGKSPLAKLGRLSARPRRARHFDIPRLVRR